MKVYKEDSVINTDWIWNYTDEDRDINVFSAPDKTYAVFAIFILDRLSNNIEEQVKICYNNLVKLIEPFNKSFPWSEYNGILIRIEKLENGMPFIFGQLCVEDNTIQEESLLVGLLRSFSKTCGPEVFIKVCDTDCDFLMVECHSVIPEEFDYPVPNNRVWLHEGCFKMIPTYFYPGRGLTAVEALEFLSKAYYKCVIDPEITKVIESKFLTDFSNSSMTNLGTLHVSIEDNYIYDILLKNKVLAGFLLKNITKCEIDVEEITSVGQNTTFQELPIVVSKSHANMLSAFMDINNLKVKPELLTLYAGRIISSVLKSFLEDGTLQIEEDTTPEEEILSPFHGYVFDDISLDVPAELENDVEPTEELMDKLSSFFSMKPNENAKQNLYDSPDDDEKYSDNQDRDAKNYLRMENIDIDEDDFFEYFLKEGLKLDKSEIQNMRSTSSQDNKTKLGREYETVEEKETLEELESLLQSGGNKESAADALEYLFESLSVDGVANGPFQNILRNLQNTSQEDLI